MSELKRCPFCGGEAEMGRKRSCFDHWEQGDFIPRCKDTKCLGRLYRTYKTEEEAIDEWNIRKPMERILERLKTLKQMELDREDACDEDGFGDGEEIFLDGASQGRHEAFYEAIEIVKEEGGIE